MRVRALRTWALLMVLAVTTAACGNRLSRDDILAQNTVEGRQAGSVGGPGESVNGDGSGTGDDGAAEGTTGGAESGAAGVGDGPGAGGGGAKAPIVVGLVGYFSGLAGATLAPGRDVWSAWASSVNKRGGINGHPVQLLIGDDGGNASRSVSIARDFVENKGAIVLSYFGPGLPIADYAKQAGVPVVGSLLGYPGWNSSPGLFPPFSASEGTSWGIARGLRDAGAKKVASLYCAEAPDCQEGASRFRESAEAEGLEVVYQAQYSVLQPDFTAECLQLRERGAQGVYPSGDPASMLRMAQACERQGLDLIWITPTAEDAIAKLPQFDNAVAVSVTFPWFLRSGLPGLDEYTAALKAYAPGRLTEGNSLQTNSWVSGKVLEAAGVHLPDKPTKQAMFDALWMLKGEQLGGLAPGPVAVTFTRDKPTPDRFCVFFGRVKDGKWTAPSSPTPVCR